MFRSVAAKALLGVGALGVAAGTTALAAPAPVTPAPGQHAHQNPKKAADVRGGVIITVTDTSMTVERSVRDKATKKVTRDDTTFKITAATKVFRAGSKDPLGHDAIKKGERVRVRFAESTGGKVAHRVVILPDVRAGKVISKDIDAHGNRSFVIRTAKHVDVTVVVNKDAHFRSGKAAGSFEALKVGDRAVVAGEEVSAGHFNASGVRYHAPSAAKPHTVPTAPKAQ
ncbi:MAG TPA: DUF5666 domain-containing protein [Candidatus Dormibacteraeota bacterium]|jgi:hypothetical protein